MLQQKMNEKLSIDNFNMNSYSICEITNVNNKNEIQFFLCSKTNLFLINIDLSNLQMNILEKNLDNMYCNECIEVKKENYIIIGGNGVYHLSGMPSQIIKNDDKNKNVNIFKLFSGKYYIGGIKINENIIALSSNCIYSTGEDKLLFFNLNKRKITHEIEGFSFIGALNGLSLININIKKKEKESLDKILLCACKKYTFNQKNGILLVELNLNDNEKIYYEFYETDFEVHCFCQIDEIIDEKINIIDKKISVKNTKYFLVGGFKTNKGGIIYLYECIYDEESCHSKINSLLEVDFEDLEGLKSINCIIQSKETGDILISCRDGKDYSFKFFGKEIFK